MSEPETSVLEGLTDTSLYSIGASFADCRPELVDDVIDQAQDIEETGIERYAGCDGITLQTAFQMLVTGLAVRSSNAVAGAVGADGPPAAGR